MGDALIGSSGFVGGTLCRQHTFAATFRAHNIDGLGDHTFDTIYCAGAPGVKWRANASPEQDAQSLARLTAALGRARCKRLVLLSTVDVFTHADGVDEATDPPSAHAEAYGRHRRALELFVQKHFEKAHVVRLPGLVGTHLKKNALYDLRHGHRTESLLADAVFQFYPMARLWQDLQCIVQHDLPLCHLAAQGVALGEIAAQIFGVQLAARGGAAAPHYNMRSRFASLWQKSCGYQVEREEVWAAIRAYAAAESDEPVAVPVAAL